MGTRDEDAAFLAVREEQERRMVASASDSMTAELHRKLADQYAERRRQLLDSEATAPPAGTAMRLPGAGSGAGVPDA